MSVTKSRIPGTASRKAAPFRGAAARWLAATLLLGGASMARAVGPGKLPINEPVAGGSFQVILGLMVIVAIIVGAAWFLRRFSNFQTGASGSLRILGGLPMGPRERVVLVQVGDTQLLLGVAPGRVQTLHVLHKPVAATPGPGSQPEGFADRLGQILKQGRS